MVVEAIILIQIPRQKSGMIVQWCGVGITFTSFEKKNCVIRESRKKKPSRKKRNIKIMYVLIMITCLYEVVASYNSPCPPGSSVIVGSYIKNTSINVSSQSQF